MRLQKMSIMAVIVSLSLMCNKGDDRVVTPPSASGAQPATPAQETPPQKTTPAAATIRSEEVRYEAGGIRLKGYLAYDSSISDPRPGVLVVHEWWGHNDYARKRARMLAELGYTALAVDMYGDGKQAAHPGDAQKFAAEIANNTDVGEERFRAAHRLLSDHPSTIRGKIAAIGYCFGGGVVLHMARAGAELVGVASFHGSLTTQTPAREGDVKAKVLVLNGGADPMVRPEDISAFKNEMASAGVNLEFHSYVGALHAFTNPAATELGQKFNLPLAYSKEADEASWAELKEFLTVAFAASSSDQ